MSRFSVVGTRARTIEDYSEVVGMESRTIELVHGRGFLLQWIPDSHTGDEVEVGLENTMVAEPINPDTMPRLDSLDESQFRVYPLKPETAADGKRCLVGRDQHCDVIIDEPSVSRRHAELEFDPEGNLKVTDRGSTNGTMVGRKPIHDGNSTTVEFGKSIQFGQIKFTFMPVQQFADFIRLISESA